jgi:hypothetical protein
MDDTVFLAIAILIAAFVLLGLAAWKEGSASVGKSQ